MHISLCVGTKCQDMELHVSIKFCFPNSIFRPYNTGYYYIHKSLRLTLDEEVLVQDLFITSKILSEQVWNQLVLETANGESTSSRSVPSTDVNISICSHVLSSVIL